MTPPLTPRARAEWNERGGREYGSGAIAHHFTHWLLQLGASPDLIRAGLDVVEDELRHAEMCHALVRQGGDAPLPELPRVGLELPRDPELPLEREVLRACLAAFCVNETTAVTLFQAMRVGATAPLARDTIEEFLVDEVRHREFGWVTLEWLLRGPHGAELRPHVLPEVHALIAARNSYYDDPAEIAASPPLSPADRAWGLIARDEYPAMFARTIERDIRPRLARLGLEL